MAEDQDLVALDAPNILGVVVVAFKVLIARELWDMDGRTGDPLGD